MSDYWKKRALEQQKAQHKRIDDMTEELAEYWERAIREVENDILAWYARFAREQGVTLQEAHRLLDTRDMKALRMSLKEFEEKARENKDGRWEKELAAASARAHISRLEQLELSIRNKLYELYHETEDVTAQALRDTYTDETYHNEYLRQQAEGKYSTFSEIPNDAVDKILSKPWTADGNNWSDRLWQNREALAGKLQGELVRMLVRGDTPVDAGKRLAKEMGVGLYQATRLVQTECTYAQTLADLETADKLGVDKMEYVATLEMHTCGTCGELDGSVIERKYLEPGVNAPPMHPHCRCTLVPYYEDNDTTRWARDPDTGKGKPVSDISFDEWKLQYACLEQNESVKITKKKENNAFSVNRKLINSKAYRDKFENLKFPKAVRQSLYERSKEILEERDGTDFETIVILDANNGEEITRSTSNASGRSYLTDEEYQKVRSHKGQFVILHNHPASGRPSFADVRTLSLAINAIGSIVSGHDGSLYDLSVRNRATVVDYWETLYTIYKEEGYTSVEARLKATTAVYQKGRAKYEKY